jgi:dTDP-4-dehydrorhamnose reductase
MRRNGDAVGELAATCARSGARLVLVSTNEVFDGDRTDGLGYRETEPPHPVNAYGASKLAGEEQATEAFARLGTADGLLIARTAWLYGPPGNDFPSKIIAAADRLPPGEPLNVVADEIGSPTYSLDLADAIVRLVLVGAPGAYYHLVNAGRASRLEVASSVLARCRPERVAAGITRMQFVRASTPPAWAVLENTRAAALDITLRPWHEALADYLELLC